MIGADAMVKCLEAEGPSFGFSTIIFWSLF